MKTLFLKTFFTIAEATLKPSEHAGLWRAVNTNAWLAFPLQTCLGVSTGQPPSGPILQYEYSTELSLLVTTAISQREWASSLVTKADFGQANYYFQGVFVSTSVLGCFGSVSQY